MEISFEPEFLWYKARCLSQRRALDVTKFGLLKNAISHFRSISHSRMMEQFYNKMKLVSVSVYVLDEYVVPQDVDRRNGLFDLDPTQWGLGFLISKDGHIITVSHVINSEDDLDMDTDLEDPNNEIILRRFIVHVDHPTRFEECRVVYDDSECDVAIMQVEELAEEYNFGKFFGNGVEIIMVMEVMSIVDADTFTI